MDLQISIPVDLLLVNQSDETVNVTYLNQVWQMPMIGPRPPYYTNPSYVLNYPII
ncbi:MAG: hypothetical protein K0R00_1645 [Herbinix sp.]|jgi:hypothetical protein|nr:hypothetical protein [Herbinix sp.]